MVCMNSASCSFCNEAYKAAVTLAMMQRGYKTLIDKTTSYMLATWARADVSNAVVSHGKDPNKTYCHVSFFQYKNHEHSLIAAVRNTADLQLTSAEKTNTRGHFRAAISCTRLVSLGIVATKPLIRSSISSTRLLVCSMLLTTASILAVIVS